MICINTVYFLKFSSNNKQDYSDIAKAFVIKKASEMLNVQLTESEFEKTENGKPYFKNFPDFNFNISHTEGGIAIGFSEQPIGVDIEKIRSADKRIVNKYFNDTENDYILSNNKNLNRSFFEIWTKKEAYIKCHGLSLKHLKKTDTSHIHTFNRNEYIISVCSGCDKSKLIFLENIDNI